MTDIKKENNAGENFGQWKEKIEKSMHEVYVATDPVISALDQDQKEIEESARQGVKEEKERFKWQIFFFIIMVLLVPLLIVLWNLHPVLGILGIVGYVWLVKNKIQTGYYLG